MKIPDNNLSYPVLITIWVWWSTWSGFLFDKDDAVFLVTAKHVLEDSEWNLYANNLFVRCPSNFGIDKGATVINIEKLDEKIIRHPDCDLSIIKIWNQQPKDNPDEKLCVYVEGVKIVEKWDDRIVYVDSTEVNLIDDLGVANDVYIYWYPTSLNIEANIFPKHLPLIRKGIIAWINKPNGTIILDCPVFAWNSGGLIVEVTEKWWHIFHRASWVISRFVPFMEEWQNRREPSLINKNVQNSGYSIAICMDKVLELIKK